MLVLVHLLVAALQTLVIYLALAVRHSITLIQTALPVALVAISLKQLLTIINNNHHLRITILLKETILSSLGIHPCLSTMHLTATNSNSISLSSNISSISLRRIREQQQQQRRRTFVAINVSRCSSQLSTAR